MKSVESFVSKKKQRFFVIAAVNYVKAPAKKQKNAIHNTVIHGQLLVKLLAYSDK